MMLRGVMLNRLMGMMALHMMMAAVYRLDGCMRSVGRDEEATGQAEKH